MHQRFGINKLLLTVSCLLFILVLSSFAVSPDATIYYVDSINGKNSNSGIARHKAFKTIQRAMRELSPGDRCIVLQGFYDERVHIRKSGHPDRPISLEAEGKVIMHGFTIRADYVHLSGFEITDTINKWDDGAGIFLKGKFCQIRNNYIHDVTRMGISLYALKLDSPLTSNCRIQNNRIQRAGLVGIEIQGRNHLIENNDISEILQHPPKWKNPNDWADADGLRFFGSGHIIRKNYVHDIRLSDDGNVDPHIDGAQTWGPAYDITFEQNFFDIPDDNMQGFMIAEDNGPVRDIIIQNNIIKAFRGLNVFDCENIRIVNNTFKSKLSYTGGSAYGIELHDSPNSSVVNNLFYDTGRNIYPYLDADTSSESGLEVGFNCHFMSNGTAPAGTPWPNDLWQVNPQLVNVSDDDFRLRISSPCIDAGTSTYTPKDDFQGDLRPQGAGYDIGVDEYNFSDFNQDRDLDGADLTYFALENQNIINLSLPKFASNFGM